MIPDRRIIPILAAALIVGVAACGGPKSVMLRATMDVQPAVNPDSRGRPSPVVVRVYALKSLAAFNSASFFSLYGKDKETLGAELIDSEELQLIPGDKREFQKEYPPETRYLAVFAAFRDVEHAHWRDSIALDTQKAIKVQIRVENTNVSIVPAK
jgi:type VI secretion system protein VasD